MPSDLPAALCNPKRPAILFHMERVYVCHGCGYVWAVETDACPICDSVEIVKLEPPPAKPRLRLIGFSPIVPGDPTLPGATG